VKPDLYPGSYDYDDAVTVLLLLGIDETNEAFPSMLRIFGFRATDNEDEDEESFGHKLDESMYTVLPEEFEVKVISRNNKE